MSNKKVYLLFSVLIILALALAACGGAGPLAPALFLLNGHRSRLYRVDLHFVPPFLTVCSTREHRSQSAACDGSKGVFGGVFRRAFQ